MMDIDIDLIVKIVLIVVVPIITFVVRELYRLRDQTNATEIKQQQVIQDMQALKQATHDNATEINEINSSIDRAVEKPLKDLSLRVTEQIQAMGKLLSTEVAAKLAEERIRSLEERVKKK